MIEFACERYSFVRPRGIPRPYAHHYRFGGAENDAPLVIYFGGRIHPDEHRRRAVTEPHDIAREFANAFELVKPGPVGLLVCPCPLEVPIRGKETATFEEFLRHHYDAELIEQKLGQHPRSLACVGNSNGAWWATYVGVMNDARAIALFGASDMKRVSGAVRPILDAAVLGRQPLPRFLLLRNQGDRTADDSTSISKLLAGPEFVLGASKPGEHSFASYAANGAVGAAFQFALENLQ